MQKKKTIAKKSAGTKSNSASKPKTQNAKVEKITRKSVRFDPDPLTLALLFLENDKSAHPSLVGLVLNESFGGCSILVNHDGGLKIDQKVKIKVGLLAVMEAKVVWSKNLEESIYKIGLKFDE